MTKNAARAQEPTAPLMRILADRKREILEAIQDKFRDVRAEAEWKENA